MFYGCSTVVLIGFTCPAITVVTVIWCTVVFAVTVVVGVGGTPLFLLGLCCPHNFFSTNQGQGKPTIMTVGLLPLLVATVTAQIPLTPTECQVGDLSPRLPLDAGRPAQRGAHMNHRKITSATPTPRPLTRCMPCAAFLARCGRVCRVHMACPSPPPTTCLAAVLRCTLYVGRARKRSFFCPSPDSPHTHTHQRAREHPGVHYRYAKIGRERNARPR